MSLQIGDRVRVHHSQRPDYTGHGDLGTVVDMVFNGTPPEPRWGIRWVKIRRDTPREARIGNWYYPGELKPVAVTCHGADPATVLAAVRRGLDAAAQQATAATQGPWWGNSYGEIFSKSRTDAYLAAENALPEDASDDDPRWQAVTDLEDASHVAWVAKGPLAEREANEVHIAAWSPSRVLAHVGSLRTICDGIEATLARYGWNVSWRDEELVDALSSLAGLAAVWAPTEQETP